MKKKMLITFTNWKHHMEYEERLNEAMI